MAVQFLIKGATVMDSSGMPAYEADVRVIGRKIVEAGHNFQPKYKERVFDATGNYLTPELIEAICYGAPREVAAVASLRSV